MTRTNLLTLLGLLAGAGVSLVAVGCGARKTDPRATPTPEPTLQVITVQHGSLIATIPATGVLTALPNAEASLTPQVTGALIALPVRYGQHVSAGQIIAQISPQALTGQMQQAQASLGQSQVQVQQAEANSIQQQEQTQAGILQADANLRGAQASLAAAQATLTADIAAEQNAKENLSREQTLYKAGLVPQKDVETAQLAVQTDDAVVAAQKQTVAGQQQTVAGQRDALAAAKAQILQNVVKKKDIQIAEQQVKNAEGSLETARSQMALYTIRSPLSGVVTAVGASVGESVDTTTKLATISNLSLMQLQVSVPTKTATKLAPGDAVVFTADTLPGKSFLARVQTISPQVDSTNGAVPILAVVRNPSGLFEDDMTVSAEIVSHRTADSIVVPAAAVLTDPDTGATTVCVVGNDGIAHDVPVRIGVETGGYTQIVSGLSQGETIAIAGQFGIPDGSTVHTQSVPPSTLPADPVTHAIPVEASAGLGGAAPTAAASPAGRGGQKNGA